MKKFLLTAAVLLTLGATARADDPVGPDGKACEGSIARLTMTVEEQGGKFKPLSAEETMSIIAKRGPPPVEPPFQFGVADDGQTAVFVIYTDDCIRFHLGPGPIEQLNKFLGRVEAQNG